MTKKSWIIIGSLVVWGATNNILAAYGSKNFQKAIETYKSIIKAQEIKIANFNELQEMRLGTIKEMASENRKLRERIIELEK